MTNDPLIDQVLPAAAASPAEEAAPEPLKITEDERELLVGYMSRRELIALKAQQEMAKVLAEQSDRLAKIAQRLGMEPAAMDGYGIDLETREIRPKAKAT